MMGHSPFSRIITCTIVLIAQFVATGLSPGASAQQLSIRHYDVADGLAHSHVSAMHQDAKGYLWLATWEGLSRFDGYRFTNYGQRDGLGDPIINDITEDRQGTIWVATNGGGVARLIDESQASGSTQATQAGARQRFVSYRVGDTSVSNRVNALLFDSRNDPWCATDGGLYRGAFGKNGDLNFAVIVPHQTEIKMAAFADGQGRLWFGIQNELIEVVNDQIIRYGPADEVGRTEVESIIEDRRGRLLVANQDRVFEFISPAADKGRGRWQGLPLNLKANQGISALLSDSSGVLWVGTSDGLIKYYDGKQTLYTGAQGLSDNHIQSLAEDRDGNLWIGSFGGGVCKLSSELIVTFGRTEGLSNQDVQKVFQDSNGQIYASIRGGGIVKIVEDRAIAVPGSQVAPFTDLDDRVFQDRNNDWWIGTNAGLFRFQGPELQLHRGHKFTAVDDIAAGPIMSGLYQDPSGKIWVYPQDQGLFDLDPALKARAVFRQVLTSAIAPAGGVGRMIGDRSGELWLGAHEQLGKLMNGRLVMIEPTAGLPETRPRAFFVDSRGWLWIGLRYKGVSVSKDPNGAAPKFINYSTATGLASDAVWTIAEDDAGHMYFGTGKGLDQLDLTTGRIRHFNTDDGLASDVVNYCLKDKAGNIWVGTTLGLSKFNPHVERLANQPAPIYLSRITVAGEDLALPETGAIRAPELELAASRNNLQIEYVALSFQGEARLRYQYKLEGVDREWSAATDVRSINYARLGPGSYRFLVRAINEEGIISPDAATFQFRILRPIWQRWWFLALTGVLIMMGIYAVHRQRTVRLIELERVRTRIATDLHDDIGANLSLIAMMSEVAGGQLRREDGRLKEWFATIATTSRDTVDAMSDIVWAVNPKRDQLSDLTHRMRRFAADIFAARNLEFHFHAAEPGHEVRVGADVRREVFLIFKEAINNIVRHSECSDASVELKVEHGWLGLEINDNGKGFEPAGENDGNGLPSMRQRAGKLGGTFELVSSPGDGTTVTLRVPLHQRARS